MGFGIAWGKAPLSLVLSVDGCHVTAFRNMQGASGNAFTIASCLLIC